MRLERKQKRKILKSSPTLFFFFFLGSEGGTEKGKEKTTQQTYSAAFFSQSGERRENHPVDLVHSKIFLSFWGGKEGGRNNPSKRSVVVCRRRRGNFWVSVSVPTIIHSTFSQRRESLPQKEVVSRERECVKGVASMAECSITITPNYYPYFRFARKGKKIFFFFFLILTLLHVCHQGKANET